jgi:hypothetical protein
MRDQEIVAKHPYSAQTGWFVQATNYRMLNQPPRPLLTRLLRDIFLDVAATPPLPRRGLCLASGRGL